MRHLCRAIAIGNLPKIPELTEIIQAEDIFPGSKKLSDVIEWLGFHYSFWIKHLINRHPDPVAVHELCFTAISDHWERWISWLAVLRSVVAATQSILVLHESIEALWALEGLIPPEAKEIYDMLEEDMPLLQGHLLEHPDIISTSIRAKRQLMRVIEKQKPEAMTQQSLDIFAEYIYPTSPYLDVVFVDGKLLTRVQALSLILLQHVDPIARHEASFTISQEWGSEAIKALRQAIAQETSIVAFHEAIEALGMLKQTPQEAQENIEFLLKIISIDTRSIVKHPDVLRTFERAIRELQKWHLIS